MQRIKEPKIRENIGKLLRKKRTEKGVSQEALSKSVDLSRTYLNLIENGRRTPSYDTVQRIVAHLGMNVDKLGAEAEGADHDPEIRLPYLLSKLLESRDREKLTKLLHFIESLG